MELCHIYSNIRYAGTFYPSLASNTRYNVHAYYEYLLAMTKKKSRYAVIAMIHEGQLLNVFTSNQ